MTRLAGIAVLTIICGLSAHANASPPIRAVPDARVGPASTTESARPSDARFALFRAEPPETLLVADLADARAAAPDEIAAIQDEARSGRTPTRNGFRRELPTGLTVDLAAGASSSTRRATVPGLLSVSEGGAITWAGTFRANRAWALRILLTNVTAPQGTRFLVCGKAQADCTAFGPEVITDRAEIWSPIVEGDTLHLEVSTPAAGAGGTGAGFVPAALMEVISPDLLTADVGGAAARVTALDTSCMANGECISDATLPDLSKYRSAYAHLQFVEGGSNYICSGALVNDDGVDGFIPYLLTANHCFDSQASASSLVSYFDYRYSSCAGGRPSLSTLPKVYGGSLLATNSSSDFTFLRLSSNPTGTRYYLGWDARGIPSGATLYRLSHPYGWPQYFSTGQYLSSPSNYCSSLPPSRFAYSTPMYGGTAGGSSGSPVLLTGGYIVGQLYGACGTGDLKDPCDPRNMDVDGSFASTWSVVWQWLRPSAAGSKPVPDFGYSPAAPRVGESVQFTDISSNGPTSWSWNFGDGLQSTQKNPTHVYANAGTYTVYMTANNAAGSGTTSRTITVNALPLPPAITYFGANPPAVSPGQMATLTWNSTGGTSAYMTQGIGQVSTNGNRTIVPVTGVPYTLTVSGPGGTTSATLTIASVGTTYANSWIVPSTARVVGAGGAFWTTDLTLMNPEAITISVNLKFLGHGDSGLAGPERSFTLYPMSSVVLPDVLGSEFGLVSDWGPILVRTVTGAVVTQAQTSTPGGGGTYGQSVPAVARANAITTTPRAICGIRQDSDFRTNIVLVNLAEQNAQVDLLLMSSGGSALASIQETLGPLGFRQLNIANNFGVSNVVGATLIVSSKSAQTPVAAYASVIDNRTADPRTLLPQ